MHVLASDLKVFINFPKMPALKKFLFFLKKNNSISGKVYLEPWYNSIFLYFRKDIFRSLT